ncbi:MAG: hypothetical protein IJM18_02755 [Clostridia bacterium]|nr:hypothetical protein [Clostridia bacterium]
MKKTAAIFLATLMLVLSFPVLKIEAKPAKTWTVPEGYFEDDYNSVVTFLETADTNGLKNGYRLNPDYDPNDPETWHTPIADDHGNYKAGIGWETELDGLKHLTFFSIDSFNNDEVQAPLCGSIDLSGCKHLYVVNIGGDHSLDSVLLPDSLTFFEAQGSYFRTEFDLSSMGMNDVKVIAVDHNYRLSDIDVSNFDQLLNLWAFECRLNELDISRNSSLASLMCYSNNISSLDISNNPNLELLICYNNRLSELNLQESRSLMSLQCNDNYITDLDLSCCESLDALWTWNNPMTHLDLSACPNLENFYDLRLGGLKEIDITPCIYFDIDYIGCEGGGTIGCYLTFDKHNSYQYVHKMITAQPNPGEEFMGWYNDEGELVSMDLEYDLMHITHAERRYTAYFTVDAFDIPEGYCENDYVKMRSFLETENEEGIKNGQQMRPDYDPNDPETWTFSGFYGTPQGVQWVEVDGVKYASSLTTDTNPGEELNLVGDLDVSDFSQLTYLSLANNSITSLNASGSALSRALLNNNPINSIDLEDCTALYQINCSGSQITDLDLSDCTSLAILDCSNCNLTSLDLSNCTEINSLNCAGNPLTELDLTNNPGLPFDIIRAEGNGTIGMGQGWNDNFQQIIFAVAAPQEGESFICWFDDNGELISENEQLDWFFDTSEVSITARFTENVSPILPGDVDGNGEVMVSDAIMALRAAMGILELTEAQFEAADMNANGSVEVADAVTILRVAMGLMD